MAPTANALMSSPPMKPAGSIASRWRELQGARSWAGLLDPLDDDLRRSVINYGELAQAAYDGFNLERRSPHAGSCLYSRAGLLTSSTVLHPERYTVTKFLYATSGQSPASRSASSQPQLTDALFVRPLQEGTLESNWMGYVAVATDEGVAALGRRDIVVAWRGTATPPEWGNDFDYTLTSAAPILGPSAAENYPDAQVHHGFLSVYTSSDKDSPFNKSSARNQVLEEVKRLMELHKDEVTSITVTGHSLGASLATLSAVDIVANGVNVPPATSKQPPCPVTAILLASPRVGNDHFKTAFASFHHLRALHVKNARDIVPNLPPKEFGYVAAATATLPIDTDRSPYLLPVHICGILDIGIHDLECYLHGVAGDNGADKEFDFLVVQRDVALVNKWADALKYDYPVPASWWVVSNKCMVIKDGHWELDDFKEI